MALRSFRLWPGALRSFRLGGGRTPYVPGREYIPQVSSTPRFTADAVIKATVSSSFTANAVIRKSQTGSFTASAALAGRFTVDAFLRATQASSFTVSAALRRSQAGSFTVDAARRRTQTGSLTANAVKKTTQATPTLTVRAILRKTGTGSLTVDATIKKTVTTLVTPVFVNQGSSTAAWNVQSFIGLGVPIGTIAGDVMVAFIASDPQTTDRVIDPPAGWTQLAQIQADLGFGGDANYNTMFWKVNEGESSSLIFSWGAPDSSYQGGMAGGIVSFRYASGPPAYVGNTDATQSSTHTTSTLTVPEGSVVGVAFTGGGNVETSWTPPAGFTELWDRWTAYVASEAAYAYTTTTGTKGPYSAAYSGSFSTVAFIWSLPGTSVGFSVDAFFRRDFFFLDAWISAPSTTSSFTVNAVIQVEWTSGRQLDAVIRSTQSGSFALRAFIRTAGLFGGGYELDAIVAARTSFTIDARIVRYRTSAPDQVTLFCDTFDRVVASGIGDGYTDLGQSGVSVNGQYAVIAPDGSFSVEHPDLVTAPATFVMETDLITPPAGESWSYFYAQFGNLWWELFNGDENAGSSYLIDFGTGTDLHGNTYVQVLVEPQQWYRVKAEQTATQIRSKLWKVGTTEPDWQITRALFDGLNAFYLEAWASQTDPSGIDNVCITYTPTRDFAPFTIDAVITKKTGLGGLFLLSALILRNSFTVNARLGPGFQAYALLRAARTSSFTANAWINLVGLKVSSRTIDAVKRKTGTGSFTANAFKGLVITTPSSSKTIDAIILGVQLGSFTFTLDAVLGSRTKLGSFTLDAETKGQNEKRGSFTVSALLRIRPAGLFMASAFIGTIHAFHLDAFFVIDNSHTFTVAAVLHRQYLSNLPYATKVLRSNPVWYLPLQETSGTNANDASVGGTDDGTMGAALLKGQPGPALISGATSIFFGATTDQIVMAAPNAPESRLPLLDDPRSYEIWFRNDTTGIKTLFDYGENDTRHRFRFYLNFISNSTNDPDYLTLLTWGDDPNIYVPSQVHNDDQWHHLVVTYGEASTVVPVWIDAVMVGELILGDVLQTQEGGHRLGIEADDIWMTQAAVYDRELTDEEIAEHALGDGFATRLRVDAIIASTTGVIPTRQYPFTLDAMTALYPQAFTADALLIKPTVYGTFTVNAWFLGTLTTTVGNPPIWVAAVIRGATGAGSFTVNAFVRTGITVNAWIANAQGGLYGGRFSVDAYIFGSGLQSGGIIVWPDDGGPAEFPDGEFVPVSYKSARKFRVRIFVAGVDITGSVIWTKTTFTQNAKTNPGTFELALEGVSAVDGGEEVWVTLDDYRVFGGIVLSVERTYAFADSATTLTTLRGADFNLLLDKYVVYNTAEATGSRGEYTNYKSFAKGTMDSTIIHKVFEDYIDPPINHTDYVDSVAIANPEKPWAMPTPGTPIRQVLQSISQITSAVWWIDAYKNLHYHSRSTITAPFPITDGLGGISSQNLSVQSDISKMVTETFLWGTLAQTVAGEIMVSRRQSPELGTYGLWQQGEVRSDIHHQAYIDRRADSIIERYGVPIKRAKATIFEPGYQAGMVAQVKLSEHGIDEVLVIRELTLEFAVSKGKLNDIHYCVPRYQLVIGLDPEEPWDIYDYLPWPDDKGIPNQPYNERTIPDPCLDGTWTNPCVEQGGFRGGYLLDSFSRVNEDIYLHYDPGDGQGGRDTTPSWGQGETVNWTADTFIKNHHYAVDGSYGVIKAMNAHYVHVNEQNGYYPSSKGQSTTVPMNDLVSGDVISMKALLFGFRIQPTERIINSVLTSAGEFNRINWDDTGAMTDTTGGIDPKPDLDSTATADATVSGGPTLMYATFAPAEGGEITGTVLRGSVDDAGQYPDGAWYGSDGGGMVSWQKRYANSTLWRPGVVNGWTVTDTRAGLHFVQGKVIRAWFYIATDERRGGAWTNAVHIEFKSGNSYVRISRPEVGGGAYGVTTHTTSSGADTTSDGAITIDPAYDYYCKWWRPGPGESYVKIWPQGGAEPDDWIATATNALAGTEAEPTNRSIRVGASVFNMQMYDLMIDFVASAPDEDDFVDCDEDDPCDMDEDVEGELYGMIGQGWNTEMVGVDATGRFETTAKIARGSMQVFDPDGALIPQFANVVHGVTDLVWDLDGPSGQLFRVFGGAYPRFVTCFYRAYVLNVGSEYRAPRVTFQPPWMRTIPP